MKPAQVAIDFGNDSDTPPRSSSEFEEVPYPSNSWPAPEELPLHYMSEEKARRRPVKGAHDDGPISVNIAHYDDDGKDVYNKLRAVKARMGSGRPPPPLAPPATNIVSVFSSLITSTCNTTAAARVYRAKSRTRNTHCVHPPLMLVSILQDWQVERRRVG